MANKKMNRDYPLSESPDPGERKPYLTARALRAENLREEAKDESRSKRAENLRAKASKEGARAFLSKM